MTAAIASPQDTAGRGRGAPRGRTATAGGGVGGGREAPAHGPDDQRPADPTLPIVNELRQHQRTRVFAIKELTRGRNATLAFVRTFIGYSTTMPEGDRKAVVKRAERIVAAIEAGRPAPQDDAAVADAVAGVVLAAVRCREPMEALRTAAEKRMEKLARSLPVWGAWAESVRGLGAKGLAVIVAEAGDPIGDFRSLSGLHKRLGLALVGDRRQGDPGPSATAEDWIAHGYSARRRAEMHAVVAEPLLKAQSARTDADTGEVLRDAGPYRALYDRKRAEYDARVEATRDLPATVGGRANPDRWTPLRAHQGAMRYMTKKLIRDLHAAWRRAAAEAAPTTAREQSPPLAIAAE
jgi:hypothetical protein